MGTLLIAVALAAHLLELPLPPSPGDTIPLFNGTSLDGWEVPKGGADHFVVADGVLRVRGRSGRLLTMATYDDYVLAFQARSAEADSVGGVFIRTLTTLKQPVAYEVQVANGRRPSPVLRLHRGKDLLPTLSDPPAVSLADDEWHDYRVECFSDTARVLRDGKELLSVRGMALNTGRIGLHAERGTVELRDIVLQSATGIRSIEPSPIGPSGVPEGSPPPPGVGRADEGTSLPQLIRDVKPFYTEGAMRLRLEGEVWLECIVGVDGNVERCTVLRRLSTELDAQAVRAALQWKFEPGRRDGRPVRVQVTVSMSFTLR